MGNSKKVKAFSLKEKIIKFLSFNRLIFLLSLVLVIFLSNQYLFHKKLGLLEIPKTTDILDEKNYIWAAKSFLQTKIPTAWSTLDAYKKDEKRKNIAFENLSITFKGKKPSLENIAEFNYPVTVVAEIDVGKGMEQILMVQPFFDHSFISGLIYGLNTPDNIESFTDVQPEKYRLMAIYISVITGFLLFFLTYLLYRSPLTAILSFIIYSTVSVYILISRYALIENILIPLTLLSLIFLVLSRQKWVVKVYQKRLFWILSGIMAGLALTTKELGAAALIAGVLLLLIYKISWKNIIYFLAPAIMIGSLFYLYALAISPKLFFDIFINQANRGFFGPLNFIYAFYRPRFAGFPLEGYWIFGFVSLFFLTQELEKHREVIIGFLSYLLIFLLFGGLNYPWYSLIFVPFIVIASAIFIKELLFNPSIIRMIVFFLFPFSSSLYWGHCVFRQPSSNIIVYRIFVLAFLFLIALSSLKKKIPGLRIVVTLALLVILWKMYQWNHYGFEYLIANWGKLPDVFMWKL